MCGGGGSELGGIGPGDESYTMWFCASIDDGGHRHCTTAVGPHSRLLSILLCNRLVSLKIEKTSLLMFISKSKAWHMDELLCLMFASRDVRTTNAEHQWRRWRHIYFGHAPSHLSLPVCLVCHVGHVRGLGSWSSVTISYWSIFLVILECHICIPGNNPSFNTGIFCNLLGREMVWGN